MFEKNLLKLKNYISNHNFEEINEVSNITSRGIYLIYIDEFLSNTILPIYVGQTENFQKRYKEHISKLLTLNRIDYNTLKEQLDTFSDIFSVFEGNYLYLKIFKYLIDNNLTLDNIHMVILKKCDSNDDLYTLELEYINKFSSSYFGFNQLNSVSLIKKYNGFSSGFVNKNNTMITSVIEQDLINYDQYRTFGFNEFNYWLLIRLVNNEYNFPNFFQKKILEIKKYYLNILPKINEEDLVKLRDDNKKYINLSNRIEKNLELEIEKIIPDEERKKQNGIIVKCILSRLCNIYCYNYSKSLPDENHSMYKYSNRIIDDIELKNKFHDIMSELINYRNKLNKNISEIGKISYAETSPLANYIGSCEENLLKYIFPSKHFDAFSISKKYVSIIEKYDVTKCNKPTLIFSFSVKKDTDKKIVYVGLYIPDKQIVKEWILDDYTKQNYINTIYNNPKLKYYIGKNFELIPINLGVILTINQEYYTGINDKIYKNINKCDWHIVKMELLKIIEEESYNFQIYVLASGNNKMFEVLLYYFSNVEDPDKIKKLFSNKNIKYLKNKLIGD